MELRSKPDFEMALKRVEAWFRGELLDRPPVRFHEHNADFNHAASEVGRHWPDLKSRWFDAEYQVDAFIRFVEGHQFYGETFPVYCPNLGPNIYAAYHGAELEFGEVTSWIRHCVHDWEDVAKLQFSRDNVYFQKIEEISRIALEKAPGRFMVGYTDLHGSLDCVADWRDPQVLCMDLIDNPERVQELVRLADRNFLQVFDHYDSQLKAKGQLSINWMGIPSRGKMHVPSCDFTAMVSTEYFDRYYLPSLETELRHMTHNIFHLDGRGMIRHLDRLLSLPQIHAVQWVQGVGGDQSILQWIPLIRRIQASGRGVVVDLKQVELEAFIGLMSPERLYLCISASEAEQPAILKRVEKWGG